jgi:N-acetylglucosamine-6-phosphate deacetylase
MESIRGRIYRPDGKFRYGQVSWTDGLIWEVLDLNFADLTEPEREQLIVPGFVDIHSHGCIGNDTCETTREGLTEMLDFQRSIGVTSYLPTTMSYDEEKLTRVCETIASVEHPTLKGIYLEGPFLSRAKRGAQNEKYLMNPDADMIRRLQKAAKGLIRVVAIAPELEGAIDTIKALRGEVIFSLAHTMADYDTAMAAFRAGATQVTHLFNAMRPYLHREPGLIGACFDEDRVMAELICDGIHVHDAVVRNTFRQLTSHRVVMISDSMEATGMPDGQYALGGQEVHVEGKKATLTDGTIAGSACTLYDCFYHAVTEGIPLEDALYSCTASPAHAVGLYSQIGSIEPRKRAEMLVLDEGSLMVRQVIG